MVPAVRTDFQKLSGAASGLAIKDYELEAIRTANTPAGMTWKQALYDNPDSPNKRLAKVIEGFIGGAAGRRCGDEQAAQFSGCVAI
jgi:hypothetical protein